MVRKTKVKKHKRMTKKGRVTVKKHSRKYTPSKTTRKKKYKQVGTSSTTEDRRFKAKPAGWRKSAKGNWYFENRKNRSDAKKYV